MGREECFKWCAPLDVWNQTPGPGPVDTSVPGTRTLVHAITCTNAPAWDGQNTHAQSPWSDRTVIFTELNELSNLPTQLPRHYRGISILQHVILPVRSSPTPLMQAPGQAGRNWIAAGTWLWPMKQSGRVCIFCAAVHHPLCVGPEFPRYFFFFLFFFFNLTSLGRSMLFSF